MIRIYFRTLRFIAFNWAVPFFMGIAVALALITYGEDNMLDLLTQSFVTAAVQLCAQ